MSTRFQKYATEYDPIKIGSIDGTDTEAHDRALLRALHSEYSANKQVKGDPYHTVFIGRLNPRTKQDAVEAEFSKFGRIVHCRLVKDIVTGKSKRYAFVSYADAGSAGAAARAMHGSQLERAELVVELEAERRLRGWRPRRLGGGFGGRREAGQLRFGCAARPFKKPIDLDAIERDSDAKECTGWFKSFTKVERLLAALEAALLVVLLALLVLLILHLIACSGPDYRYDVGEIGPTSTDKGDRLTPATPSAGDVGGDGKTSSTGSDHGSGELTEAGPKCSWTPSAKTEAAAHYYEGGAVDHSSTDRQSSEDARSTAAAEHGSTTMRATDSDDDPFELSDGEDVDEAYRRSVAALVKLKPPKDIIFGCILTVVSERWTLTAASCIEAIEETDSLDSFVIMARYGEARRGPLLAVDDVRVHPLYEGRNGSYDLAALRGAGALAAAAPLARASTLDLALLPLAERLTLLGFGAFRSIAGGAEGRALRRARVHLLAARACAEREGAALRHLWAGRAESRGACGRRTLCAGVVAARALPCNYCAGAPLLRGARLLALMAANRQCGVACEPQLFVSLPDKADWIDATLAGRADD